MQAVPLIFGKGYAINETNLSLADGTTGWATSKCQSPPAGCCHIRPHLGGRGNGCSSVRI